MCKPEQNNYLIHNNKLMKWAETLATSSFNACEKVGWLFQDCHIQIKKEVK